MVQKEEQIVKHKKQKWKQIWRIFEKGDRKEEKGKTKKEKNIWISSNCQFCYC